MKKIDRLFVDLDGCLSKGAAFPKIPPFDLKSENANILEFLEFRDLHELSCHAVTGRSVKISEALLQILTTAPSVMEHGTILYDGQNLIHLIEFDKQYKGLKEAREELESFIAKTAPNWIPKLQGYFPQHSLRMLSDNLHIWTIEVYPADIDATKKLQALIREIVLPPQLIGHIKNGYLKELVSNGAYDLMPAVSKKAALESLIRIKKIDVSASLGIEDSFHADGWLQTILQGGGVIGCPANSDERLKEIVREAGIRGYVANQGYFRGSMEILNHFIKE